MHWWQYEIKTLLYILVFDLIPMTCNYGRPQGYIQYTSSEHYSRVPMDLIHRLWHPKKTRNTSLVSHPIENLSTTLEIIYSLSAAWHQEVKFFLNGIQSSLIRFI